MMGPGDLLIMKDQGDPSIMMDPDPGDLSTMKDQEECKGDQEDHQMSSRIKTLEGQDQEALDQEDQGLEDQDQEVDHHNLDNLVMDLGDQLLQAPVMQEMVLEILAQEGPTIILL